MATAIAGGEACPDEPVSSKERIVGGVLTDMLVSAVRGPGWASSADAAAGTFESWPLAGPALCRAYNNADCEILVPNWTHGQWSVTIAVVELANCRRIRRFCDPA